MIERKLEDSDYSAVELAAAFLKMQMGEEPQEIQEVIPERRRNYRGSRDFGSGRQDRDNRSGKDGRGNNPRYGRNDGKRRSFPVDKGGERRKYRDSASGRPAGSGRTGSSSRRNSGETTRREKDRRIG